MIQEQALAAALAVEKQMYRALSEALDLTREILEKESGYLRIRSQVNRGTEVSLFLLNYHG